MSFAELRKRQEQQKRLLKQESSMGDSQGNCESFPFALSAKEKDYRESADLFF